MVKDIVRLFSFLCPPAAKKCADQMWRKLLSLDRDFEEGGVAGGFL